MAEYSTMIFNSQYSASTPEIKGPCKTEATNHNIAACCRGFLENNVASVCMGLKV